MRQWVCVAVMKLALLHRHHTGGSGSSRVASVTHNHKDLVLSQLFMVSFTHPCFPSILI